jgi:SAM-dependent methyltransferase
MLENAENLFAGRLQLRRRPESYAITPSPADQKFIGFLISASGVAKGDRVLEVACGTGSTTLGFAERCGSAVGIDVMEEPLSRARAQAADRGINNAEFRLSEVERLEFDDASFNGSFCRFSFHHIVNPRQVFAEMARVVAPGGWMAISDMVSSEDPEDADFQNQMERLADYTHCRTLPCSEFEAMFAENGLRVVMKVGRDARLTLDDWIRFGGATPENAIKLRQMAEAALDEDRAGMKFMRDGDKIRLIHNSFTFVLEKE